MSYSLKSIKTFRGMEGYGLNATLLKDNKPVAFILDEGCGGEVSFDFHNPKQTAESFKSTTYEQALAEEHAFAAFCYEWMEKSGAKAEYVAEMKKLGAKFAKEEKDFLPTPRCAMETWVNRLVDEQANKQRFDRLAKKHTLFRLEGDSPDAWRTIQKLPYGPQAQAWLDKKYPGKVTAIYGVSK